MTARRALAVPALAMSVALQSFVSISSLLCSTFAATTVEQQQQREPFQQTTLEQAFSRAYNVKVADGTWASLFGVVEEVEADSYCTGDVASWPLPARKSSMDDNAEEEDEELMDDLERVLQAGMFTCGWVQNLTYRSNAGQVLMESVNTTTTTGAVVDWWTALVAQVSDSYNTPIVLKWKLFPTSQDTLTALHYGEIDAACGYWHADGTWEQPAAVPSNSTINTTATTTNSTITVARGLAFSFQTCPTAMMRHYIYTPAAEEDNSNNITDFETFVSKMRHDAAMTAIRLIETTDEDFIPQTICVSEDGDGDATVRLCQATMNQALRVLPALNTTNENTNNSSSSMLEMVTCQGFETAGEAFASMDAGDCIATWSGYPPPDDADDESIDDLLSSRYNVFSQPRLIARGTYFRSANLNNSGTTTTTTPPANNNNNSNETTVAPNDIDGSSTNTRYYERTTLEQALTRAFNILVHNGTYAKTIAGLHNVESTTFCTGDYEAWPLPPISSKPPTSLLLDDETDDDSDLATVLRRRTFRCGYPKNQVFATSQNQVFINSSVPHEFKIADDASESSSPNDNSKVTGIIADFWKDHLIPMLGELYGIPDLKLEWILQDFSVQTLNELYAGTVDAACVFWWPNGVWVDPKINAKVARPVIFSPFYCPAFLQADNVYTLAESNITSWDDLVEQAKEKEVVKICVSDDVTGGAVTSCQTAIDEYMVRSQISVPCDGSLSNEESAAASAFRQLTQGSCQAVWAGVPPENVYPVDRFNAFRQPTLIAPVSFFRTFDVRDALDDGSRPGGSMPAPPSPTDPAPAPAPTADDTSPDDDSIPTPETSGASSSRRGGHQVPLSLSFHGVSTLLLAIVFVLSLGAS